MTDAPLAELAVETAQDLNGLLVPYEGDVATILAALRRVRADTLRRAAALCREHATALDGMSGEQATAVMLAMQIEGLAAAKGARGRMARMAENSLTAEHFAAAALEAQSELQNTREEAWLDALTIAEWLHAAYYAGAAGAVPNDAACIDNTPQVLVRLLERDGLPTQGAAP